MVKTDRSFWLFILLTIVTCGIYSIVFFYNYVEDMNVVCQRDGKTSMNYILVLILSMVTCGIFGMVWIYQMGERIDENSKAYGITSSANGSSLLLWSILGSLICVGPYVAVYKMIEGLNCLAYEYNKTIV